MCVNCNHNAVLYLQLAVVHDSARIIQCLVQYGGPEYRTAILEEIKRGYRYHGLGVGSSLSSPLLSSDRLGRWPCSWELLVGYRIYMSNSQKVSVLHLTFL